MNVSTQMWTKARAAWPSLFSLRVTPALSTVQAALLGGRVQAVGLPSMAGLSVSFS